MHRSVIIKNVWQYSGFFFGYVYTNVLWFLRDQISTSPRRGAKIFCGGVQLSENRNFILSNVVLNSAFYLQLRRSFVSISCVLSEWTFSAIIEITLIRKYISENLTLHVVTMITIFY